MFDVTTVQNGLEGLVGIRQPLNPTYAILDANNIASTSGRYLDDIPHYKTEFFIDTLDYKDATDAQINDAIRDVNKAAINTVCSAIFSDNSYIDRNYLYTQATERQTTETTLVDGFVGFEITPCSDKNIAFKITNIRLEFQGTGTVKLLLFNTNKNAPIFSKDVVITDTDQVETLNWTVNSTNGDYKGRYYLGYIYDGSLIPFKRDFEAAFVMNNISELNIQEVFSANATDATIFPLDSVFGLDANTGLNPDITVYEDYTDLILQNAHLLAHAIQLQWAITMMQRFVSSIRSNRNERYSKEVIGMTIQQIEGSVYNSPIKVTGLNKLLATEIANVSKVIEDMKRGYFGGQIQVITAL